MAINLWIAGGKPTSYNPLPSGWSEKVTLEPGEYVASFMAKSPTSAKLGLKLDTQNIYPFNQNITTDFKEYTVTFTNTLPQPFYVRASDGVGDIVIENVVLTAKGTGKATINGVDGFGTVKPGFTGKLSATADYKGKLPGSTLENPHHALAIVIGAGLTTDLTRENFGTSYGAVSVLGLPNLTNTNKTVGGYAQHRYSFNVIAEVEKQIGVIPAADKAGKLAWIKSNIQAFNFNWHGYGATTLSNPTGKADFTGKVSGSTVANPHRLSHSTVETTLKPPSFFTFEPPQANYDDAKVLDNSKYNASRVQTGVIAQQLFSFNLIEYVKRKYGYTPDVAWLKANISKITANWHGYGSSAGGYKSTLTVWSNYGGGIWDSALKTSHSLGSVQKLTQVVGAAYNPFTIQSDGFIHFIVNAEPSDGVTSSSISTDFIDIDIDLVAGSNKASVVFWVPSDSPAQPKNEWRTLQPVTTTASTVTKLVTLHNATQANYHTNPANIIDPNGFVHYLAFAEPSNGVTTSTITTDFVELVAEMKQATIVDSKWTFNPNVTLIDDETIEFNNTAAWQESTIVVPCLPSTTYIFKSETSAGAGSIITPLKADGSATGTNIQGGAFVSTAFSTPSNAYFLKIRPMSNGIGKYTISRPILNLGEIPVPYSKKTGERMVPPIVKKNLISSLKTIGTGANGNNTSEHIVNDYEVKTKPTVAWAGFYGAVSSLLYPLSWLQGRTLTLSFVVGEQTNSNGEGQVSLTTKTTGSEIYVGTPIYITNAMIGKRQSMTVTVPTNAQYLNLGIRATGSLPSYVHVKDVQLEEGSTATSFGPYGIQVNAQPKKLPKAIYKPTDYKFPGFTSIDDYGFKVKGGYWYTEGIKIPVLPNTEYTYSFRQEVISGGPCFTNVLCYPNATSGVLDLISETGYTQTITSGKGEKTFTTPPNCNYIVMRVARSNTSRSYEVNYYDFRFGLSGDMENKRGNKVPSRNLYKGFISNPFGFTNAIRDVISEREMVYTPESMNRNSYVMMDVEPNTTYSVSFKAESATPLNGTMAVYNEDATSNLYGMYTSKPFSFNSGNRTKVRLYLKNELAVEPITFKDIQFEKGAFTPYEAYQLASKPGRKGLEFDGNSRIVVNHEILNGFDVETEFIYGGAVPGTSYAMLWSLNGNANYVSVRTSDNSLFISTKASGGVQHATGRPLKIVEGVKYRIRVVYDPIDFSVKTYSDGLLIDTFQETAKHQTDSKSVIGSLTPSTQQSQFKGVILSQELKGVYKYDFTNPSSIVGPEGTITGSPRQLNKLAKR
jgi:hypothetical protein